MPLPGAEQSTTDTLSRAPAPARVRRAWPRRALKLGLAATVLGAGALAELGSLVRLQSTGAVVSAPRIALRSPIAGVVVEAADIGLGQTVRRGTVLARVANPLMSALPLDEARARVARLEAELDAAAKRRAALLVLREDLLRREAAHAKVVAARLDAEIAGAGAALAAGAAQEGQFGRDLARQRVLAAGGDVARAALEHAQAAYDAATQDDLAQAARRDSLRAQRDAAASGVFAETGPNEASYATQRGDELALRLDDLDQSVAGLRADLAQARRVADATEADLARRATAEIVAPTDAMLWRQGARPGDRVAEGETVADLVQCDQQVVVATVATADVAAIAVGGIATVRLAGDSTDRQGEVIGTYAEGALAGETRLAALPALGKAPGAVALVALPPDGAGCPVGREASVRLPRAGGGRLRGLLDRVL